MYDNSQELLNHAQSMERDQKAFYALLLKYNRKTCDDPHYTSIEEALTSQPVKRSDTRFIKLDLENDAFSDGRYDVIIATRVVYFLRNEQKGLYKLLNQLNPRGTLYVDSTVFAVNIAPANVSSTTLNITLLQQRTLRCKVTKLSNPYTNGHFFEGTPLIQSVPNCWRPSNLWRPIQTPSGTAYAIQKLD